MALEQDLNALDAAVGRAQGERVYVTSLTPRAKRYLRMIALGKSQQDARMEVGLTANRASLIANSIVGQAYLEEVEQKLLDKTLDLQAERDATPQVTEEIRRVLENEAPETLDRLLQLRDAEDEKVALAASKDLLDRAGFKPTDKMQVESKVIATEGLLEALDRLKKAEAEKQPAGETTDSTKEDAA